MIQVKTLTPGDTENEQRWDAFVQVCASASFFHRSGWQRVIRDVFRHPTTYLYAEADGAIVGILPLAQVKSWLFGNSLASLPFAVYGGVAAHREDAAVELEHAAHALAQELGVDHLEYRNVGARHADWPTQDLYVTFRKNLLDTDDANMLAIPRKQRAMVRKGIKNGLTAQLENNPNRFFDVYADKRRPCHPPCPEEERPVAGDALAARDLAANDFKYWELMRRARERGCRVFDYGRSKQGTGPYAFKKNWGFEPSPLHYEYRLYRRDSIPQNNPANAKYRLLIATWRRLPIGFANWLGPFIVRNLG